jgi:hypothetical protein
MISMGSKQPDRVTDVLKKVLYWIGMSFVGALVVGAFLVVDHEVQTILVFVGMFVLCLQVWHQHVEWIMFGLLLAAAGYFFGVAGVSVAFPGYLILWILVARVRNEPLSSEAAAMIRQDRTYRDGLESGPRSMDDIDDCGGDA